jgi:hypothetical protein
MTIFISSNRDQNRSDDVNSIKSASVPKHDDVKEDEQRNRAANNAQKTISDQPHLPNKASVLDGLTPANQNPNSSNKENNSYLHIPENYIEKVRKSDFITLLTKRPEEVEKVLINIYAKYKNENLNSITAKNFTLGGSLHIIKPKENLKINLRGAYNTNGDTQFTLVFKWDEKAPNSEFDLSKTFKKAQESTFLELKKNIDLFMKESNSNNVNPATLITLQALFAFSLYKISAQHEAALIGVYDKGQINEKLELFQGISQEQVKKLYGLAQETQSKLNLEKPLIDPDFGTWTN